MLYIELGPVIAKLIYNELELRQRLVAYVVNVTLGVYNKLSFRFICQFLVIKNQIFSKIAKIYFSKTFRYRKIFLSKFDQCKEHINYALLFLRLKNVINKFLYTQKVSKLQAREKKLMKFSYSQEHFSQKLRITFLVGT